MLHPFFLFFTISEVAEWYNHLDKWNNYLGDCLLLQLVHISRYD